MPIRPPQKTTPQGGSPQPFPLYAEHTRVLKQPPDLPPIYQRLGLGTVNIPSNITHKLRQQRLI
jgi:hypothetical protein